MDKLYTVDEVSNILQISANTIRIWLNNGTLKGIKVGKYWRVKESQLNKFTKEQEKGAENE